MRLRLGTRHDSPGERTADDCAGCDRWCWYPWQRLLPKAARALDTQELEQNRSHHLAAGLTRRCRRLLLSSIQRSHVLHFWILNRCGFNYIRQATTAGPFAMSAAAAFFFSALGRYRFFDAAPSARGCRSDCLGIQFWLVGIAATRSLSVEIQIDSVVYSYYILLKIIKR